MKMTKITIFLALICGGWLVSTASAADDVRGVTDDTIIIGTVQDLSGPIAQFGQQALNGMLMAVDHVNADGGINGRKLELKVADSGYQPQKALLATRRMVQRDNIFAMIGMIGSAPVKASMPILMENNVFSLFPLTAATLTYLPRNDLKWGYSVPYAALIRIGMRQLMDQNDYGEICAIYQNDPFGTEVLRGVKELLPYNGKDLTLAVSFQRGETNFTAGVSKLKAAGCDLVVMGTVLREPPAIMATAHKLDWHPTFVASVASYSRLLPALGGDAVNGLYAVGTVMMPYTEGSDNPALQAWAKAYQERFGSKPDVFAAYGYMLINSLFKQAVKNAGDNLTVASMVKALENLKVTSDLFGAKYDFGPERHMGASTARLFQIVDGKWQPASDWLQVKRTVPLGSEYAK